MPQGSAAVAREPAELPRGRLQSNSGRINRASVARMCVIPTGAYPSDARWLVSWGISRARVLVRVRLLPFSPPELGQFASRGWDSLCLFPVRRG